MEENKQRVIQEYVPGKQITLAHLVANPNGDLSQKLGLSTNNALGIMTITPSEAAIIAADVATKAANITIGFLDRFTGSLVITGAVSEVESALNKVNYFLENTLAFYPAKITRS